MELIGIYCSTGNIDRCCGISMIASRIMARTGADGNTMNQRQ